MKKGPTPKQEEASLEFKGTEFHAKDYSIKRIRKEGKNVR